MNRINFFREKVKLRPVHHFHCSILKPRKRVIFLIANVFEKNYFKVDLAVVYHLLTSLYRLTRSLKIQQQYNPLRRKLRTVQTPRPHRQLQTFQKTSRRGCTSQTFLSGLETRTSGQCLG